MPPSKSYIEFRILNRQINFFIPLTSNNLNIKSIYWVWILGVNPNQNPNQNQFRILFYTFWYRNHQKFKIFDTQSLKISDFFENF